MKYSRLRPRTTRLGRRERLMDASAYSMIDGNVNQPTKYRMNSEYGLTKRRDEVFGRDRLGNSACKILERPRPRKSPH